MSVPKYREMRHTYGFDDIAIVPGDVTINPEQTNTELKIGNLTLAIPILASAMDGVVDPKFAIALGKAGGMAVLNLDGVQVRYDNPDEILSRIASAPPEEATALLQKAYQESVKEKLIGERIRTIKKAGVVCAVSVIPANAKKFAPMITEAKADILVVQSTVTTARHRSRSYRGLLFSELCQQVPIPVVVGNCVTHSASLELMRTGVAGILVGVGPGAACTTREVLGVGVPQVTATNDCAAARDEYLAETGRYVSIIADGGIRNGGDLCKAFASGADGVMLGSIFAQAKEAPGRGYHWGMSTYHASLPRGTRIKVGVNTTVERLLFGPTSSTGGVENLVGALRTCMGVCGASNVKEMHRVETVIAPSLKTEGKSWQLSRCF